MYLIYQTNMSIFLLGNVYTPYFPLSHIPMNTFFVGVIYCHFS